MCRALTTDIRGLAMLMQDRPGQKEGQGSRRGVGKSPKRPLT